jgi:lipoate-protein ligase A
MKLLELTLDDPAENLALDEALLEAAEQHDQPLEVLRLWESAVPLVVLGRSSRVDEEVDQQACRTRGIPILRRCSGGAAVVAGPGCLLYAVVLSYALRPHLRMISEAHRLVMQVLADAFRLLGSDVCFLGTSDLTIAGKKFSGNSLRCKRSHLLYHGTLLYDFPLDLIARCLRSPPRQPDYRQGRSHGEFLTNLAHSATDLRRALIRGWQADELLPHWPVQLTRDLAATKYRQLAWTFCAGKRQAIA